MGGDWEDLLITGPPAAIQLHRRRRKEDAVPAAMASERTRPPKKSPVPPLNPNFDGSNIDHDPTRKEDKPKPDQQKDTEVQDTRDDTGSDDTSGNSSSDTPIASEADHTPPNQPLTVTQMEPTDTPEPTLEISRPPEFEYSTVPSSQPERNPPTSGPQETSTIHPTETQESTTSHSWTITTKPPIISCTTAPHCSTGTKYSLHTTCYSKTPGKSVGNDAQDIGALLDKGKIVVVILLTMVVSILITVGCIWVYKRRAKKRRGVKCGESRDGDVEGGAEKRRKFWGVLGKRKERGNADMASVVRSVGNTPAIEHAEASVPPEMAQRSQQRLSIILPPGAGGHRHRNSNNTILNRTLSAASSLTVPPYPGSSAASGTTRSSSTRTARSIASNTTDDTVVRTKREYRDAVGRLTEENMHSDHVVVADGFHLAPPNPFEDDGPQIAGAGGMGGSGVGVGGLGDVDGEGNRRVGVGPPPPIIRVRGAVNPFEDQDIDLDMGVADGFRPNGGGGVMQRDMRIGYSPPWPPQLENPFEDGLGGLGGFPEIDVGMGDGFDGYVPGQMGRVGGGNVVPLERRVSMRGGDARRRVSGDRATINSSISGESLSSSETLRGDLEDWSGSSGAGSHADHSSGRGL